MDPKFILIHQVNLTLQENHEIEINFRDKNN